MRHCLAFLSLKRALQEEASVIETALATCHLDVTEMRGQAQDGASNMLSQYNGCATLTQQNHPLAVHSHCCGHVLNLAVLNAYNLVLVQNQFATISKVFHFFDNHPKRQYVLNGVYDDLSHLKVTLKN